MSNYNYKWEIHISLKFKMYFHLPDYYFKIVADKYINNGMENIGKDLLLFSLNRNVLWTSSMTTVKI